MQYCEKKITKKVRTKDIKILEDIRKKKKQQTKLPIRPLFNNKTIHFDLEYTNFLKQYVRK